jgi:hypothetical protein
MPELQIIATSEVGDLALEGRGVEICLPLYTFSEVGKSAGVSAQFVR